MTARITIAFPELGSLTWNGPEVFLDRLNVADGATIEARDIGASTLGIDMYLPTGQFTYRPHAASESGTSWQDYYGALAREMLGEGALALSLRGLLAALAVNGYQAIYQRELAGAKRSRGRPKRVRRYDEAREELFARILEGRQQYGLSLRDSIRDAAKLEPDRFRREFGDPVTEQAIEAAAKYFKRHSKETKP